MGVSTAHSEQQICPCFYDKVDSGKRLKLKSLMNQAAILPAHLSEPVTSVLLISRTGSYSAIPEGRKEGRNTCIFHTDGLSSMPTLQCKISLVAFCDSLEVITRKSLNLHYEWLSSIMHWSCLEEQRSADLQPKELVLDPDSSSLAGFISYAHPASLSLYQLAFTHSFIIPWALPPCWLNWHVRCLMSPPSALAVCPFLQSCTNEKWWLISTKRPWMEAPREASG